MTLPEKFCIAPFKNMVVGNDGGLQPCCEFMGKSTQKVENVIQWWTKDLNVLRQDMLDGKVIEGCSHCINKEKNPEYTSHRQALNKIYKTQLVDTVNDFIQGKELVPEKFELKASNYCNLKCIMCGEYASSSINQEYQKYTTKYNEIGLYMENRKTVKWWDDPEAISNLQPLLENAKSVALTGGEPLLVKRLFDLLENTNFKNPWTLSLSTSLYTEDKKYLESLSKFDSVTVNVSVEGIGSHNDYVRFGSKWDIIKENIELLKDTKVKLVINHVLQHTSIFTLPALIEFSRHVKKRLLLGEVAYHSYPAPGVLTINSAHPSDVANFSNWLSSYDGLHKKLLTEWLNGYKYDSNLNQQFHKYVSMLDSIRNTNFKETFNPTYD